MIGFRSSSAVSVYPLPIGSERSLWVTRYGNTDRTQLSAVKHTGMQNTPSSSSAKSIVAVKDVGFFAVQVTSTTMEECVCPSTVPSGNARDIGSVPGSFHFAAPGSRQRRSSDSYPSLLMTNVPLAGTSRGTTGRISSLLSNVSAGYAPLPIRMISMYFDADDEASRHTPTRMLYDRTSTGKNEIWTDVVCPGASFPALGVIRNTSDDRLSFGATRVQLRSCETSFVSRMVTGVLCFDVPSLTTTFDPKSTSLWLMTSFGFNASAETWFIKSCDVSLAGMPRSVTSKENVSGCVVAVVGQNARKHSKLFFSLTTILYRRPAFTCGSPPSLSDSYSSDASSSASSSSFRHTISAPPVFCKSSSGSVVDSTSLWFMSYRVKSGTTERSRNRVAGIEPTLTNLSGRNSRVPTTTLPKSRVSSALRSTLGIFGSALTATFSAARIPRAVITIWVWMGLACAGRRVTRMSCVWLTAMRARVAETVTPGGSDVMQYTVGFGPTHLMLSTFCTALPTAIGPKSIRWLFSVHFDSNTVPVRMSRRVGPPATCSRYVSCDSFSEPGAYVMSTLRCPFGGMLSSQGEKLNAADPGRSPRSRSLLDVGLCAREPGSFTGFPLASASSHLKEAVELPVFVRVRFCVSVCSRTKSVNRKSIFSCERLTSIGTASARRRNLSLWLSLSWNHIAWVKFCSLSDLNAISNPAVCPGGTTCEDGYDSFSSSRMLTGMRTRMCVLRLFCTQKLLTFVEKTDTLPKSRTRGP
eukprot:gene17628-biopygen17836